MYVASRSSFQDEFTVTELVIVAYVYPLSVVEVIVPPDYIWEELEELDPLDIAVEELLEIDVELPPLDDMDELDPPEDAWQISRRLRGFHCLCCTSSIMGSTHSK